LVFYLGQFAHNSAIFLCIVSLVGVYKFLVTGILMLFETFLTN
jgi:hypothetical protein